MNKENKYLNNFSLHNKISESVVIALLLTFVGGFLDIYTYIARGQIFANTQTGNMIFMIIEFSKGNLINGSKYILPIISFVLGVFIVEIVRKYIKPKKAFHYRHVIIVLNMLIILIVSFIKSDLNHDMFVNSLISFIVAMQFQSFRKVNGELYASTMCTGNLRSMGHNFIEFIYSKNKKYLFNSLMYFCIILVFLLGVTIGYFSTLYLKENSALLCNIFLFICFIYMLIKRI